MSFSKDAFGEGAVKKRSWCVNEIFYFHIYCNRVKESGQSCVQLQNFRGCSVVAGRVYKEDISLLKE